MNQDICPNCGTKTDWSDFYCQNCGSALTSPKRPKTKQYRSNIQIVGIAEIVLGFFHLLGAVVFGLLIALLPRILELEEVQSEITDPAFWEIMTSVTSFKSIAFSPSSCITFLPM